MKNKIILLILAFTLSAMSQTVLNVGIGPSFHGEYRDNGGKVPWNATIEIGRLFDNIIGVGVDLDFAWAVQDSYNPKDSSLVKTNKNKMFMFPISATLFFDPLSKFKLHPVIKGQFGFNMMVRDLEVFDSTTLAFTKSIKDGFYMGFIGKGALDLVFDLGEHAAIFLGFEFQGGRLRHRISKNNYTRYNFNAPALRMGFSFLF